MDKILDLNIEFDFGYEKSAIHPVIITGEEENILIDCGYPGFLPFLEEAAKNKGFLLSDLTHIIITHHDHDHMGSLKELKEKYPYIKSISSCIEKPYIERERKSLRLEQAEALYPSLSQEEKKNALIFHKILENTPKAYIDITIAGDKKLDWCGGMEIIATPGHMPGHIAVYIPSKKTLITGDALTAEGNTLLFANPQYTLDMVEARKSIEKFLNYDIETIICYHGGVITGNIQEKLKVIIDSQK